MRTLLTALVAATIVFTSTGCGLLAALFAPPIDAAQDDADRRDAGLADIANPDRSGLDAGRRDLATADTQRHDQATLDTSYRDAPRPERTTLDTGPAVDGATGAPPCGTVDVFGDDFAGSSFADIWHPDLPSSNDVSVALGNGELNLTVPLLAGTAWNSIQTWADASLRHGSMAIRVADSTFASDQEAWAYFEFRHDNNNLIRFLLHYDRLYGDLYEYGQRLNPFPFEASFVPAAHRWWQLRGSADQVTFETSSDGITFTPLADIVAPWFVDRGRLVIGGGTSAAAVRTRNVTIAFDDLNRNPGRTGPGSWCPAHSLQDDFAQLDLDATWYRRNNGNDSCVISAAGQLHVSTAANTVASCSVATTTAYALTGSSVTVHVAQLPPGDEAIAGIFLADPTNSVEFGISQSRIVVYANGVTLDAVRRDQATWLRITLAGSTYGFWTAPETGGWQLVGDNYFVPLFDPVVVDIGLRPYQVSPAANDQQASFDSYNLP